MEKQLLPHQQRVVDEKNELQVKLSALYDFINVNPIYRDLNVEDQEDLIEQSNLMQMYFDILERRISKF